MLLASFEKQMDVLLLPVTFSEAFEVLKKQVLSRKYDFVLMLGQAGGRSKVGLERVLVNMSDSNKPDESGVLHNEKKILKDGPDAFVSRLPLRSWCEEAERMGLPIEVSNTAGLFVCNFVAYQMQALIQTQLSSTESLFVHLPFLPEQAEGKTQATPTMPLIEMQKCVDLILKKINEGREAQ